MSPWFVTPRCKYLKICLLCGRVEMLEALSTHPREENCALEATLLVYRSLHLRVELKGDSGLGQSTQTWYLLFSLTPNFHVHIYTPSAHDQCLSTFLHIGTQP